jgi:carbonic anhydrase
MSALMKLEHISAVVCSSEGVKWYVRKTPTSFSKDQIAAFTTVYDHNNRPVQALIDPS